MGKSFELFGLAAFNIFLALILSSALLSGSGTAVDALTRENVKVFITDVAEISSGQRANMDQYSVTNYLMTHIDEDGRFKSKIEYAMPNMPASERALTMNKDKFISHTLQGMGSMEMHETAVKIEYIDIQEDGQSAEVTTTNYERGVMPVQDAFGDFRKVPVTGTSYCEQTITLTKKKIMQMSGANCTTNISFAESY